MIYCIYCTYRIYYKCYTYLQDILYIYWICCIYCKYSMSMMYRIYSKYLIYCTYCISVLKRIYVKLLIYCKYCRFTIYRIYIGQTTQDGESQKMGYTFHKFYRLLWTFMTTQGFLDAMLLITTCIRVRRMCLCWLFRELDSQCFPFLMTFLALLEAKLDPIEF